MLLHREKTESYYYVQTKVESYFSWQELQSKGLQKDDYRLRESMKKLKQAQRTLATRGQDVGLDRKTFKE